MSKFAFADLTAEQLNAIVKKLGGHKGALRFLRGELVVSKNWGFLTTVDYDKGITALAREAVQGGYASPDLINLKLIGDGKQTLNLELAPFLEGENGEQAAERLTREGFTLHNIAELAAFLGEHPEEVRKHWAVLALGKESRRTYPDGDVAVPYAYVDGNGGRELNFCWFAYQFRSWDHVLVSRK